MRAIATLVAGAAAGLFAAGVDCGTAGTAAGRAAPATRPPQAALRWLAAEGPDRREGLTLLDGADGAVQRSGPGQPAATGNRPGASPESLYLYFRVDRPLSGPAYVAVEYLDRALVGNVGLEYDGADPGRGPVEGAYAPADEAVGGYRLGTGKWRRTAFRLAQPRFAHRQNLGADFRLTGGGLWVRRVELSTAKPADWDALARGPAETVPAVVRIGKGMELTIGGFDAARAHDAAGSIRALEARLPLMKAHGMTSHEAYVRWNLVERQPGVYDWSVYDAYVRAYRKHGVKWVPFLIVGSAYSLPDWFYKSAADVGYRCLEHGEETPIQSLWAPATAERVRAFIRAFAEHYGKSGVLESVLLGVTGNYGEAIYPATDGTDWTADIHGRYHSHPGYWCGDRYAQADFRKEMRAKYRTIEALSAAWGRRYASFDEVGPFRRAEGPSDRAWLDFAHWYVDSMTRWSKRWLETTRKALPKTEVYLCTGGDAPPQHGADFGEQVRAAASVGAGVRITNEGSSYPDNFTLTRWVASAGRFYGSYFGFEPASGVDAGGIAARIYNVTASGARQLHDYANNPFDNPAATAQLRRYGGLLQRRTPVVPVAVYYPETWILLHGQDFLPHARALRDYFDFDLVSDGMIRDGALGRYRALVLLHGNTAEKSTWAAMAAWAGKGGVLLSWSGFGVPSVPGQARTTETRRHGEDRGGEIGLGRGMRFEGGGEGAYRSWLAEKLAGQVGLPASVQEAIRLDGRPDGVYCSVTTREILWLNTTAAPLTKVLNGRSVDVPAHGIGVLPLAGR
jgi:hypothetical protein